MPTVQTNDIETYYERRGDGPVIVFVHGAHVDHAQWEPQLVALSDEYTTIAYDVRGHGRTGGSAVEHYSVELFADDLDALVTALDLEKPVVCGFSTGGAIAQVYATTYPEKLSGLVLSDTFTPGDWHLPERIQWLMLRATIPSARLVRFERVEKAMVWLIKLLRGEEATRDYEKIVQLRADMPTMATEEFVKVTRALLRFPRAKFDLSTVSVPTLVVYGEHEPGWMKRHAAKMAAKLQNARVEEVPGGGHASTLAEPERYADVLRTFLVPHVFEEGTAGSGDPGDVAPSA